MGTQVSNIILKYVYTVGYHGEKYENGQRALSGVYGIVENERDNFGYRELLVKRLDDGRIAWIPERRCVEKKPWSYMSSDEKREVLTTKILDYKKCIADKIRYRNRKPVTTENQYNKLIAGLARLEQQLKDL